MKLTVTTMTDLVFSLDVNEDMELENLKALCEFESGIPAKDIVVMFEGKPLDDDKKDLKSFNVRDGDMLLIHQKNMGVTGSASGVANPNPNQTQQFPNLDFGSIQMPNQQPQPRSRSEDPAVIRDTFLSNPEQVAILKHNNPRLAEALETSLEEFTRVLTQQQNARAEEERRRIRMLVADPFDPEAQRMIAEDIQKQAIDSNMETAMEYHPESYGEVTMLYIDCIVNDFHIKAFVDSGAQSTIMSKACAQRCNIMHLVDTRWSGIAKGVGTQRILGRVHLVQLQIGRDFLSTSFTILEEQSLDVLIGLDMLKRHQCIIDLKRNLLLIGTTGTETHFLSESELPEFAKHKSIEEHSQDEDAALAEAINKSIKESASTSSGANTSSQSTSSTTSSSSGVDNQKVNELVSMGFDRNQVVSELRASNGDKNLALASLLAKSIQIPNNLRK